MLVMLYEAARTDGLQCPWMMSLVGIYLQNRLDREMAFVEIQFQVWAPGTESRILVILGVMALRSKLSLSA